MRVQLTILTILLVSFSSSGQTVRDRPLRKISKLNFTDDKNPNIQFEYSDTTYNVFLRQLRVENNLIDLIKDCKTDLEKLIVLTNWTNTQWKHNGSNQPTKNDALTILKEAKQGKQFRCVEYGIVLSTALNSIGLKSRIVYLKTQDVEIVKSGAGHALTETYLPDIKKWVMADGQFNVIPTLNNLPLNLIEFQNSIVEKDKFELIDQNGKVNKRRFKQYKEFIPPYLYYFDTRFDNRFGDIKDRFQVDRKSYLMLVPKGANNPTIFQVTGKIEYCYYTNSIADFYKEF